jgi:isoamylase
MIEFRKQHSNIHRSRFFTGERNERGLADITWHGCQLNSPGWNDAQGRTLAFTLGGFGGETDIHVLLNMYWDGLEFELPQVPGRTWFRSVDTALPAPQDIAEAGQEVRLAGNNYIVSGHSVVVLISK